MQSSMWKLLTVVGIIGIGSLVVLEVQNRLPMQNPAARTTAPAAVGAPTESNVIPDDTTDLDRMLAGELGAEDSPFTLNEPSPPDESNTPNDPGPLAPPADDALLFANSEPVNRTVLKDSLADDANLFDRSGGVQSSSKSEEPIPASDQTNQTTAATTETKVVRSQNAAGRSTTQFFNGTMPPQKANDSTSPRTAADSNRIASSPNVTAVSDAPVATPSAEEIIRKSPKTATANVEHPTGLKTGAVKTEIQPTSAQAFSDGRAVQATGSETLLTTSGQKDGEAVDLFLPDELPEFGSIEPEMTEPIAPAKPNKSPAEDAPLMDAPGFDSDSTGRVDDGKPFEFQPDAPDRDKSMPVESKRPAKDEDTIDFFNEDGPVPTPPVDGSGNGSNARPNREPVIDDFPELDVPKSSPRSIPKDLPVDEFPEPTFPDRKSVPALDENAPFGADSDPGDRAGAPFDLPAVNDRPVRSAPDRGSVGTNDITERSVSEVMRPQLSIQKRAPDTATVGVSHEYTIVVSNEGDSPAYDVVVDDELGDGARLENSKPVADFDRVSGKLSWTIRELAAHEKQEIVVRITPTGEGTLDGVATVRFKAQVKSATVITAPKLTLELTGPDAVKVGDEVELHYVVSNNGSGDASNVILRSVLPPGLKHSEGGDLEYEIENLPAGGKEVIDLTVVAAEPGSYHTVSEVTASGVSADKASSDINIIGSQLTIQRLGPDRRFVGRSATFQNIITNETEFEATNAVVTEQIPEGMRFVSADNGGNYNPQTGRVRWDIDRLAARKQMTFEIELEATVAGAQESVVEVVENAGFRSQARSVVNVEDFENMTANISRQDKPVAIGESFGFTITIENRGTAVARNVEMVVEVPPEIAVKAAGTRTVKARRQGNTVHYDTVESIPPGEKMTFELKLQGEKQARNARVLASLSYDQMPKPLIVSEAVTIFDDSP